MMHDCRKCGRAMTGRSGIFAVGMEVMYCTSCVDANSIPKMAFGTKYLSECRDITERYKRISTWDLGDAILRVKAEVTEMEEAKTNRDVLEETCDIMLVCLALMHCLGLEDSEINSFMIQALVKAKNKAP